MSSNRINQSVQKIIDGNDQPSQGNSIVSMAGAKGLNASDIINSNHVLSVDQLNVEGIDEINTDTGNKFKRDSVFKKAVAVYSLRPSYLPNGDPNPVVRLRRASDSDERDFTAGELVGSVEGAELVTNGGFATGDLTGWTAEANWSVSGGAAVSDGTVAFGRLYQDVISADAGEYYKVTFTIVAASNYTSVGFNTGASNRLYSFQSSGISSTGTYTAIFKTIGGGERFGFYTSPSSTVTVDNVSVKPYTPSAAELWALDERDEFARQTIESAYATTWYDQSGNGYHATSDTDSEQPLLIKAGVTNTKDSKPAILFDGNDHLSTSGWSELSQPITQFAVGSLDDNFSTGTDRTFASGSARMKRAHFVTNTSDHWEIFAGTSVSSTTDINADQFVASMVFDGANSFLKYNGDQIASGHAGNNPLGDELRIGAQQAGNQEWEGNQQEFVVFSEAMSSADILKTEEDINNYYTTYYKSTTPLIGSIKSPSATIAYSLRSLTNDNNLQRVVGLRRDDMNRRDFTAHELRAGGEAEVWASGGNAYVDKWYDQSGNNNHAVQATLSSQPLLISSGVVNLEGGKPAISFDGSDDFFDFPTAFEMDVLNLFAVTDFAGESGVLVGNNTDYIRGRASSSIRIRIRDSGGTLGNRTFSSSAIDARRLYLAAVNGNNTEVFENGVLLGTNGNATDAFRFSLLGKYNPGGGANEFVHHGTIQEMIFYPSNQSLNRNKIETNVNNYYSIY